MEAIVERCSGLDVHERTVVACLLVGRSDQKPQKEVRTFPTFTRDLVRLRDWLSSQGCTHVAMESTGIYWKPIYAILEGSFELIVGNATHIKNVPGRKTDVKDSEWIADLTRHGLIRKSFVPPKDLRDLRDVMRYRRKLVDSRSAERNRLQKVLETANIKLGSVASDVFGVSGMLMLKALVAAESTPDAMADLARGRLRKKKDELELALDGRMEEHHRILMRLQLQRLERADQDIAEVEARANELLAPYRSQLDLLRTIPGVEWSAAATMIAEMGVDMSAFRSVEHLASWVGVCPGNHESAGKRKKAKSRKGNVHLTTALVEAAHAASRKKGSYYKDKFHRLKARRGAPRALMAIAHKLLIAAYHILTRNQPFKELGDVYLDARVKRRTASQLVQRLERLGYKVQLSAAPPAGTTAVTAATTEAASRPPLQPAADSPQPTAAVPALVARVLDTAPALHSTQRGAPEPRDPAGDAATTTTVEPTAGTEASTVFLGGLPTARPRRKSRKAADRPDVQDPQPSAHAKSKTPGRSRTRRKKTTSAKENDAQPG
jgi:transposase